MPAAPALEGLTALFVGSDAAFAERLREGLASSSGTPWRLERAGDAAQAAARLEHGDVAAALVDVSGASGCVSELAARFAAVPMLALVAPGDENGRSAALADGALGVVLKDGSEPAQVGALARFIAERREMADRLRRLLTAVETMQLGVSITDTEGRIVYANAAEAEMHGYARNDLVGRDARRLSPRTDWRPLPPDELARIQRWKRERVRSRKDGSTFPVQLMSDLVKDDAGRPLGVVTTCEDISDRKRAEAALRESEERYALAVRGTNDGIFDWRLAQGRLYLSPRFKAMLGYEDGELSESPEEWLSRIHPDDAVRVRGKIEAHLEGTTPQFEDEHRIRHKDGHYRWVLSRGFAVRDAEGRATRLAGAQTDVTDRRGYDPLTGLPNRASFSERLGETFARARRRNDYVFAVLFLDLDHFKGVNDSLGHLVGDELLITVARRLESCVRPGDLVGRFAGDEFAILLDRIRDLPDATRVAERIQHALSQPVALGGREMSPSASIGITVSTVGYERPDDLLRDADAAMYHAKARGRKRLQVFDQAMRDGLMARQEMETDLRQALPRGELRLAFQPILALATGHLLGFEALLRWQHPQGRVVLPRDFLPLAERTGEIVGIGTWVLREACRQLAAWTAAHRHVAAFYMSVNFSGVELAAPELPARVEAALHETGLDAARLRVDVSEKALQHAAAAETLRALRGIGVRVHLDDFAAGRLPLAQLERFPLDALKLDRSIVAGLGSGEPSTLVRTILSVSQSMGLDVIAEAVETMAQCQALRALGCAAAQGHYFARALPPESAAKLIEEGPRWNVEPH